MSEVQPLPNHWGQHQPRVTMHTDGSTRVLYMRPDSSGLINWRVMRRSAAASATWVMEASGLSQDDVSLLRDPVTDEAHVMAWPGSVPTIYSSPSYVGHAVPGEWQVLTTASRHYGNTGIGSDGTLCLKASIELPTSVPTSNTQSQLICGRQSAANGPFVWHAPWKFNVGNRRAYDYLFPGAFGAPSQLTATSQLDLYKTAAGLPLLANSAGNYVFNGISGYSTALDGVGPWQLQDLLPPLPAPANSVAAPMQRQTDAYISSSNHLLITYWLDDPASPTARGIYLAMFAPGFARVSNGRLSELPRYGHARVFDDTKGRQWLLWTNLGTQMTQVVLYRLQQSGNGPSLSDPVDLSAQFAPYAIQGAPMLAVPRGGQSIGMVLQGMFSACDGLFQNSRLAACYPNGNNKQRIVQFSLALPD